MASIAKTDQETDYSKLSDKELAQKAASSKRVLNNGRTGSVAKEEHRKLLEEIEAEQASRVKPEPAPIDDNIKHGMTDEAKLKWAENNLNEQRLKLASAIENLDNTPSDAFETAIDADKFAVYINSLKQTQSLIERNLATKNISDEELEAKRKKVADEKDAYEKLKAEVEKLKEDKNKDFKDYIDKQKTLSEYESNIFSLQIMEQFHGQSRKQREEIQTDILTRATDTAEQAQELLDKNNIEINILDKKGNLNEDGIIQAFSIFDERIQAIHQNRENALNAVTTAQGRVFDAKRIVNKVKGINFEDFAKNAIIGGLAGGATKFALGGLLVSCSGPAIGAALAGAGAGAVATLAVQARKNWDSSLGFGKNIKNIFTVKNFKDTLLSKRGLFSIATGGVAGGLVGAFTPCNLDGAGSSSELLPTDKSSTLLEGAEDPKNADATAKGGDATAKGGVGDANSNAEANANNGNTNANSNAEANTNNGNANANSNAEANTNNGNANANSNAEANANNGNANANSNAEANTNNDNAEPNMAKVPPALPPSLPIPPIEGLTSADIIDLDNLLNSKSGDEAEIIQAIIDAGNTHGSDPELITAMETKLAEGFDFIDSAGSARVVIAHNAALEMALSAASQSGEALTSEEYATILNITMDRLNDAEWITDEPGPQDTYLKSDVRTDVRETAAELRARPSLNP